MAVIERRIAAPVAAVGQREGDVVAQEIDGRDLPLSGAGATTVNKPLRVETRSVSLIISLLTGLGKHGSCWLGHGVGEARAVADDPPVDEDVMCRRRARLIVEHIAARLRVLREDVVQDLPHGAPGVPRPPGRATWRWMFAVKTTLAIDCAPFGGASLWGMTAFPSSHTAFPVCTLQGRTSVAAFDRETKKNLGRRAGRRAWNFQGQLFQASERPSWRVSFRGEATRIGASRRPSGREPGIHNHRLGLWIPGSRLMARPGMTADVLRQRHPL